MKQCNFFIMAFYIALTLPVYADGQLDYVNCNQNEKSSCNVLIQKESIVDQVDYSVSLVNSTSNDKIFQNSDSNSTMENLSLFKINDNYIFLKEYFDSTKALEFTTFTYANNRTSNINYYYIESSVNFQKNINEWSGKSCKLNNNPSFTETHAPLLQAISSICVKNTRLSYSENSYINNDVLFEISKITDGQIGRNMVLVALDSKNKDSINFNDIGCRTNCDEIKDTANYMGRLNGKIRVKLHLDFDDNNVKAYYYYDKIKKNIPLTGQLNDGILKLVAVTDGGKEFFEGKINDGMYKGTWTNSTKNKTYPFEFYLMLIQ